MQLYGADPGRLLIISRACRRLDRSVAPYLYADAATEAAVQELLARMRGGEVDAIAFTSKAQVERLFPSRSTRSGARAAARIWSAW